MVRLKPIVRLKLAFLVLGGLLLGPLALLWSTANERLETQRRLRHEVVGERIFDELERELTDLLDRESERPSRAYDAPTRPDVWAPFVVGYFTMGRGEPDVLAGSELTHDRRQRMEWAIAQRQKRVPSPAAAVEPRLEPAPESVEERAVFGTQTSPPSPARSRQSAGRAKSQVVPRTSPDILRQLNRGEEVRQRAPSAPSHERDSLAY